MSEEIKSLNFIEHIIEEDLKNGMSKQHLRFRFPPEPNGYLHIGHTKAIGISFGLGEKYSAPVNLRFDDTNPAKEEQEYVDAIKHDIEWLGFKWDKELYSSDYFQQLFDWTIMLIKEGKAYVDNQSSEQMAIQKGTPTEPGTNSPNRDRSIEENLELFMKMKNGEFEASCRAGITQIPPTPLFELVRCVSMDNCVYMEDRSSNSFSISIKPNVTLRISGRDSYKLYEWFTSKHVVSEVVSPL